MHWPNKDKRQRWELGEFFQTYSQLCNRKLVPVSLGDRPDAIARDLQTGNHVAVELTSVYLDDRSVPDLHQAEGLVHFPSSLARIDRYLARLLEAVISKAEKARSGYDLSLPIILSVYMNEHETLYMDESEFKGFLASRAHVIARCDSIAEVVFWPLRNRGVSWTRNHTPLPW